MKSPSDFTFYANSIRNKPKRDYAFAYRAWMQGGCIGPEPEKPAALSSMAAQAVRLNLGQCEIPLTNEAESLAKRKAKEPLRPAKDQRPCDVGLFSDNANQIDLEDLL